MFVVIAVYALALEGVIIGVASTQYDVIMVSPSCAILLSNNIYYTTNVSSCWPWTNRKYVCIASCALELERAIGVRRT